MQVKFLIIPTVLICQVAGAQSITATQTLTEATITTPVPTVSTSAPSSPASSSSADASTDQVAIIDYQSVFEAATLEEEVKMAAERFKLTPAQQEVWSNAAIDRRSAEKVAREKLDSKTANYERDGVYRGLRTAHNNFNEIITGYLNPTQKQAMETDRVILEEKRKRLAKLPPPPPPAPTVTVAPVDSVAIKAAEKSNAKSKKAKKKKKPVSQ